MARAESTPFHRTTVYLTQDQRQWLRQLAARAQLDNLSFSASDVIRLALDELKKSMSEHEIRQALTTLDSDED
jgi:hypothetical protein